MTSLNKGTFREEYSGTTIPEQYRREAEHLPERAKGFLAMFKSIENCTYVGESDNY